MKTIDLTSLMLSALMLCTFTVRAEDASPLESAKLLIASNKTSDAIPVLEDLMKMDPNAAPHNYFLGMCLMKEGIRIDEAISYLEKAAEDYSKTDVDPGMGEPEFCWYYLVIGYSRTKQCDRALETYNKFVEVYSQRDPFYTSEAVKWIELCHEPMRMAQELNTRTRINKDRLVSLQPEEPQLVTRDVDFTTNSVLYGVQVSANLNPTYTINFPGLKNVGVYVDENKVYRYVIGNLTFRSQAEELLAEVRAKGYPDAFIVDINQPEQYGEEVVTLNNHNIHEEVKGKIEFRVQIGAFAETLPKHLRKFYFEIDKLKEMKDSELTILTTGKFDTYEEARKHRDLLVQEGLSDAFVTAFNKKRRIPMNVALKSLEQGSKEELVPQKRGSN